MLTVIRDKLLSMIDISRVYMVVIKFWEQNDNQKVVFFAMFQTSSENLLNCPKNVLKFLDFFVKSPKKNPKKPWLPRPVVDGST